MDGDGEDFDIMDPALGADGGGKTRLRKEMTESEIGVSCKHVYICVRGSSVCIIGRNERRSYLHTCSCNFLTTFVIECVLW